jgi:hypothetical protein
VRKLHILCEGQTEWTIARDVLEPHFTSNDTYVVSTMLTSGRAPEGKCFKGGVSKWSRVQAEIHKLLKDSSLTVLTTLLDFYAIPQDTPGLADLPSGSHRARVEHVERALAASVAHPRFLPYLVLHEVEAWVLACPDELGIVTNDARVAGQVRALVERAGGPESVNDGRSTASSKRLKHIYPSYGKIAHGPQAVELAGLDHVRRQCPHADAWFRAVDERLGIQRAE